MPKFKKNTDYSMKGSEFYGHGNSSPAKTTDADVIKAQGKLDKIELGYRTPGWAKALGKVFTPAGQIGAAMGDKEDKGKGDKESGGGSGIDLEGISKIIGSLGKD